MLRKIDPYTVYYSKKKDRDLRMLTTGKYGGIGSIIQQGPLPANRDKAKGRKKNVSKDSLMSLGKTSSKVTPESYRTFHPLSQIAFHKSCRSFPCTG